MLLLLRNDDQKVVLVSRSKDPLVVDKKVGLVPRSKDPLVVDKKAVLVPTRWKDLLEDLALTPKPKEEALMVKGLEQVQALMVKGFEQVQGKAQMVF